MRILFHHLKISFHTTGTVFSALTIVAVGKEHDKSTLTQPLVFSSGNELIQHDLSSVDEVTKLSFPEN